MTRRLRIEPQAKGEIAEARDWYEQQELGLGYEFVEAVHAAIDRLRSTSDGSTLVPHVKSALPLRRVFVRRFPYTVIFLDLGHEVRIVAIAHQRRKPGYWRSR